MSFLELLFGWWIVTLLGIGSIVAAEPFWSDPRRKDGAAIQCNSERRD